MRKNFLTKVVAATLSLAIAVSATGCGAPKESAAGTTSPEQRTTLKVGANITPHSEILEEAKPILAEKGIDLEVVQLEDSVTPNTGVIEGSLDANYFQHVPYREDYNKENSTELVAVGNVHYEAMGVYKGTKDSLDALSEGDKIGVPNDTTNEARALQLLAANGVITLKEGVGLEATKTDITENPKNVEIVELEAASIPGALPDLAFGVINANYALGASLTTDDAVAYEAGDSEAAETYVNVIVVNKGNEESEKTKALVAAVQTEAVKKFIEEKYNGAVIAKF